MGGGMQALQFLLDGVAGFFSALFLLRFFMQARRASFANQLGGFVMQLTDWAVKPLRRVIPGLGGYDWSSLLAAYLVQLLLAALVMALGNMLSGRPDVLMFMVGHAALALLRQVIYLLTLLLILQAVISWVNPYSPLQGPLNTLTQPLLAPIRRVLPAISGIDLSPMVVIFLLQLLLIFL